MIRIGNTNKVKKGRKYILHESKKGKVDGKMDK